VPESLSAYLFGEINAAANRDGRRRKSISQETLPAYQAVIRERLIALVGPPPNWPPMRARVTGVVERDEFRVEKLIFDSRVDFPVTANLYLPTDVSKPVPAVLFPGPVSVEGKAYPSFHAACQGLARLGVAALIYDLAGTGERSMYLDPKSEAEVVRRGAAQLAMDTSRCLLVGAGLAAWHLWDGVRALEYLTTRAEIDPSRLACAGHDESALPAAYLVAMDDRIRVAVLGGGIATWRHRLLAGLPFDPALELLAPERGGMEITELLALVVPRPLLLTSVSDESSPPDGGKEVHDALAPLYAAAKGSSALEVLELRVPHGFSRPLRQELYGWVLHHLGPERAEPGRAAVVEPTIEAEEEERLWCAARGQVLSSLGGETVSRLISSASAAVRHEQKLDRLDELTSPQAAPQMQDAVRDWLRRLSGVVEPDLELSEQPRLRPGSRTTIRFRSEPDMELTAELILPPSEPRGVVLWIPGEGVAATEERMRAMARLSAVLAFEPRGWPRSAPPPTERRAEDSSGRPGGGAADRGLAATSEARAGGDEATVARSAADGSPLIPVRRLGDLAALAFLLGRPLPGMQLTDVMAAVRLLKLLPETRDFPLTAHGTGAGGVLAVMAGALLTEVGAVEMEAAPLSYRAYLRHPHPNIPIELVLPGAEPRCDLPAIAGAVAPRSVVLIGPRDPEGKLAPLESVVSEYEVTARLFAALGAQGRFHIDVARRE
jgi:hypothetical protein